MTKIIVAYDDMSAEDANTLSLKISAGAKFNDMLDTPEGLSFVGDLSYARTVMVDAKYHDIPKTVASRIKKLLTHCTPEIITVHASGGVDMMRAAVKAAPNSKIIGVTVLTSMSEEECIKNHGIGIANRVNKLTQDVLEAGAAGIVCSGLELRNLKKCSDFDHLIRVVPGIRPFWSVEKHDQKRVVTPAQAVSGGADYIVVGRPITTARRQLEAYHQVKKEVQDTRSLIGR